LLLVATLLGGGAAMNAAAASLAATVMAAPMEVAQATGDSAAIDRPASAAPSQPNPALASSTAPPWNPPAPVPDEQAWEAALRFPGRVVSLPIKVLGVATENTMLWAEEHHAVPRLLAIFHVPTVIGVHVRPATLGDRTGLGVRTTFALPRLEKYFTADWEGSTRKYSRTTFRAGYGPAWLEYQNDWRPEDRFFGLGLASSENDESNYAAETKSLTLRVSADVLKGPQRMLMLNGWVGERYRVMRGGKESGGRSFEEVFPPLGSFIDREQDYRLAGGSVTFDNRRGVPHWTHGLRATVGGEVLTDNGDNLLFDSSGQESAFTRLILEAETGVSFFMADPRTIRLYGTVIDQQLDKGEILLPDLAHLGGSAGLAGFEPRRFHDIDLALARLTYIFGIGKHMELDLHTEAGGVYGDVWKDATMSSLRNSYGIAMRVRTDDRIVGRFGVDWSEEAVRLRYTIGAVE
jgi:hypothetical protein